MQRKKEYHAICPVACLLICSPLPHQQVWLQVLPHLYQLWHAVYRKRHADDIACAHNTAAYAHYLPDKRMAKQQLFGLHHRANGPPLLLQTLNTDVTLNFNNMTLYTITHLIHWFSASLRTANNKHFSNPKNKNENEK